MRAIEMSTVVSAFDEVEIKNAMRAQEGVIRVRSYPVNNNKVVIKAYWSGKGIKKAQLPDGCKIVNI